ncbi:MAG TPA: hypothetical protein VHO91_18675, partial [Rhodopila sp.]|nr:hypothetical protein [Rhodopila sp.]
RHGRVRRIGDAPPEMAVYAIASMFGRELPDLLGGDLHIYATDCLSIHVPVANAVKDRAAGILAVALSLDSPAYLIWFRREQIQEVTWAGNPSADAMSAGADGLNPRASFEAWKQDIRGLSRAWVIEDVQVADELAVILRDLDLQGDGSGRTASDEMKRDAGQFAPPPTAVPHVMPLPNAAHRVIRIGHR